MKKIAYTLTLAVLSFFVSSCSSEYRTMSTEDFNVLIASKPNILTAEDLVKEYYYGDRKDINQNIVIEVEEIESGVFIINLLDEDIKDDSVKAIKIMMVAHKIEDSWTVYEILKSFKCRREGKDIWTNEICN